MHALNARRLSPTQSSLRGLCAAALLALLAAPAGAQSLAYDVAFRGTSVATQQVTLAFEGDALSVRAEFAAELPVFVVHHEYSEDLSATYSTNGSVLRIHSVTMDGPKMIEVNAEAEPDGLLRVVRTDMSGVSTNYISRSDYDFNSLTIYGNAPETFISTNTQVRVLDVAQGRVVPVAVETISESTTFERQNLVTVHTVWTEGFFVSHTWHPERFSNLPRRFVRQSDAGEFTFSLIR